MPTPPVAARLLAIDPHQLARSVGEALARHLARLTVPCAPGLMVHVSGDAGASGLGMTAADLCRYAQTGDLADWGDAGGALDAAQSLVEGLYTSPADHLHDPAADLGEADDAPPPWTAHVLLAVDVGYVIACALCRAWAQTGASMIPAPWIAALLGVSDGRVRQWIAEGGLVATTVGAGTHRRSLVSAESTRAWLVSRGVLAA